MGIVTRVELPIVHDATCTVLTVVAQEIVASTAVTYRIWEPVAGRGCDWLASRLPAFGHVTRLHHHCVASRVAEVFPLHIRRVYYTPLLLLTINY